MGGVKFLYGIKAIYSLSIKSGSGSECSLSRLAQLEKCESREYPRDDHFESKRNSLPRITRGR